MTWGPSDVVRTVGIISKIAEHTGDKYVGQKCFLSASNGSTPRSELLGPFHF